ncbi:MAG: hypothetical protein WC498_03605 [Candidatus Saccharimonadales bacterium]
MFGLAFGLIFFLSLLFLAILAFEVWMFVDAVRNPKLTDNEKLIWCLGMIFVHPVIAIVYYFIVYLKRTQ